MKRNIGVFTGSRAEYGQLKWLMKLVAVDPDLKLTTIVSGSHLSRSNGLTINEIVADGFEVNFKIEMLLASDTKCGVGKSLGLGIISFAEMLSNHAPDLIVVLGDRYEAVGIVIAALISGVPVAHIHGGEKTEGAIDDSFRHAITKMSHLHFVANEDYKKRVIQLGEDPKLVWNVGGLGVDAIKNTNFLSKKALEERYDIEFGSKNLLVTLHPETIGIQNSMLWINEVLMALEEFKDITKIFTMSNVDAGSESINMQVKKYVNSSKNTYFVPSFGIQAYFSCLNYVDGVLGNSSSGIVETPSFSIGTINIGDRQKGRVMSESVINVPAIKLDICDALNKLYSEEFQRSLKFASNPYGSGGASIKILKIIKSIDLNGLLKKSFYDL
jgi:GDP/UDP-N,N'-diacetylbacillosamine 2-epimerase (hydrolysing)